mmetsp:Transcript_16422/g.45182  ORF Transcript_16422/g.45182 Transcript_16422/m.45182 type:complete len:90 (-) Transcript_16422:47-316(-)
MNFGSQLIVNDCRTATSLRHEVLSGFAPQFQSGLLAFARVDAEKRSSSRRSLHGLGTSSLETIFNAKRLESNGTLQMCTWLDGHHKYYR